MINVTCAIIRFRNKILVAQRSATMSNPLKWEFPGGKIEINESAEDCIKREIREELNISIQIIKRLEEVNYTDMQFQILLIPFLASYDSGTIQLMQHLKYEWLSVVDFEKYDWTPADKILIEKLKEKILPE